MNPNRETADRLVKLVSNEYQHDVTADDILDSYQEFRSVGSLAHRMAISTLFAAILFYLLRQKGQSRAIFEMSHIMGIDTIELLKACRHFSRAMNSKATYPSVDEFLDRYCRKLGMPDDAVCMANRIKSRLQGRMLKLRNPQKSASAIIFITCREAGLCITKREILDKTFVTNPTINKYANAFMAELSRTPVPGNDGKDG